MMLHRYPYKVEEHQDIYRHIQDIKDSKIGELHISSPGVLMDMYFPRLVTEYRKQYPGIRISISERGSRSTEKDILDGSADIGLVLRQFQTEKLVSVPIRPHFPWEIAMITKKERYLPNAVSSFLNFSQQFLGSLDVGSE